MFCRIYTTGNEINELLMLEFLSSTLEIPISDSIYLEDKSFSISIHTNDDYNCEKEKDFPDGFLYFKLLIEIDFLESVATELVADVTGKILKYLWTNNYPAVASCAYEEILIEKGGYNNTNLPWM
jgi:hypothetical protein